MARARVGLGVSLLRLRSDEQLVSLFRSGNEDAFRVIHDRYRGRMHAYARQMLSSSPCDPEDVVQEIFVRAYAGLRANRRDLALRAWLYRIAHNRCIDEIRRPQAIAVEAVDELGESSHADPHLRAEQREALRRLIADVQRLPEQQRSALLMRELGGMPYADLSGVLGVSVPAVKSLLVRARVGLVQASEARDTDCAAIREDLIVAHDRGVRASGRARRHMRDCSQCRQFRREVQGVSRRFALLLPALGPVAAIAKLLGIGTLGGGAAGSSTGAAAGSTAAAAGTSGAAAAGSTAVAAGSGAAVAGGGAVAAGGAVAGGAVVAGGGAVAAGGGAVAGGALAAAGAGHVATILAATVVAAGSAIGIQQVAAAPHHRGIQRSAATAVALDRPAPASTGSSTLASVSSGASNGAASGATASHKASPTTGGSASGSTSRHGGGTATLRPTGPSYAAGTGSPTASTGGTSTTTSTTTTGTTTTTAGTTTGTGATTTPVTTTPVSGTPVSGAPVSGNPVAGNPVSGDPTSTSTTTGPTGTAAATSTTPATSAPTSTSAATTAAHPGRAGGGSRVLPRIRPRRTGGASLRERRADRAPIASAGLFTR